MSGLVVVGGGILPPLPLGERRIGASPRAQQRAREQPAFKLSLSTHELEARQAALRARIEASAAPAAKQARAIALADEVGDCATMLAELQDATEAVLDARDADRAKHAATLEAARAERQARKAEARKMAEENAALKEENAALKVAIAERLGGRRQGDAPPLVPPLGLTPTAPGAAPPSETLLSVVHHLHHAGTRRRLSATLHSADHTFKANEKAQTFFERILDFVAAKKKLDETARRVLPQNFMNR